MGQRWSLKVDMSRCVISCQSRSGHLEVMATTRHDDDPFRCGNRTGFVVSMVVGRTELRAQFSRYGRQPDTAVSLVLRPLKGNPRAPYSVPGDILSLGRIRGEAHSIEKPQGVGSFFTWFLMPFKGLGLVLRFGV